MNATIIKTVSVGSALVSFFLFPYPLTLVLSFGASLVIPWIAVVIGLLYDAVFFTSFEGSVPTASLLGAGASFLALLVRRFIKARIITS